MLEEILVQVLSYVIPFIDLIGTLVILYGTFISIFKYLKSIFLNVKIDFKRELFKSLALGLELYIVSEILKTHLVRDFEEILVLLAIVFIRGMLGLLIQWELKNDYKGVKTLDNQVKKGL